MSTRFEVEKAAHVLGDDRWNVWMKCGVHNWQALPRTDSGEHYCENCCTIWTADGRSRTFLRSQQHAHLLGLEYKGLRDRERLQLHAKRATMSSIDQT